MTSVRDLDSFLSWRTSQPDADAVLWMTSFYALGFHIHSLLFMSIFIVFSYVCLLPGKHFVKRISLAAQEAGITGTVNAFIE